MAARDFKHLEILPIDEDNLTIGSNTTSNIKSKACINLGFVAVNSIDRFRNILKVNSNSLSTIDEINSFYSISYILESFLGMVLNANSISSPDHAQISQHYQKRLITISNARLLPSFKYCQDLLYSNFKIWSGTYGTLSYYMAIKEEYEEYYTPSELIYYSSLKLIDLSKVNADRAFIETGLGDYKLLSQQFEKLVNTILNNSVESDIFIYGFSKSLITGIPLLNNIVTQLKFYQNWIPKVYDWYLKRLVQNKSVEIIENPQTNEERAQNTLNKVGRLLLSQGVDEDIFKNSYPKFVRQSIDPLVYKLVEELTIIRKSSTYIKYDRVFLSDTEKLAIEFYDSISILTVETNYQQAGRLILDSLCPPGGYTLFQIMLASILLNRAYILAYSEINNTIPVQQTAQYRRIIKLIGLAGILLIKTARPHVQSIGINLLKIFNLNLSNIQPNNLLDI